MAHSSRRIGVHHGKEAWQHGADRAAGAGSSEITSSTLNMKQREPGLLKAHPSDKLTSSKAASFPPTVPPTGGQVFNYLIVSGKFSFKPS